MPIVKFTYTQDADTVYAFASNPERVAERSTHMGEKDLNITKKGDAVHNTRTVFAEVPGFAKKFLNPASTAVEIKAWDPATRSAKLSVDIKGAPTQVRGTITIVPNPAGGCDYATDFEAICKIPLIGKKLAQYVAGVTEKGMREEFVWNQKRMDELA